MSILLKMWQGGYSLAVTFWGFYVAGYFATALLVIFIAPQFTTQPARTICVLILIIPYNTLSTIGVWRSADAYELTKWWPIMAKIAVILWGAYIVSSLGLGGLTVKG